MLTRYVFMLKKLVEAKLPDMILATHGYAIDRGW